MINACVEVAEVFTEYGLVKPPVADSRRISISVIVRIEILDILDLLF